MSATLHNKESKIDTFTVLSELGDNFRQWKSSFQDLVALQELSEYFMRDDGGNPLHPKPTVGEDPDKVDEEKKELKEWKTSARKSIALLRKTLGVHRDDFGEFEDPLVFYDAIIEQFSGQSKFDVNELTARFTNLKPEGDNFKAYMLEMKDIKRALKTHNIERSDDEMMSQMLVRLSEYPSDHPYAEAYQGLKADFMRSGKHDADLFSRWIFNAYREIQRREQKAEEDLKAFKALSLKFGKPQSRNEKA